MAPSKHIIASSLTSLGIWYYTKSLPATALCWLVGILLDVDHILEYIIHHGYKGLSYKRLYIACKQTALEKGKYRFKKIYLMLHSIELCCFVLILWWHSKNLYLLAITAGYISHLLLDQIGNNVYWHSYFILSRWIHDFQPNKLLYKKPAISIADA